MGSDPPSRQDKYRVSARQPESNMWASIRSASGATAPALLGHAQLSGLARKQLCLPSRTQRTTLNRGKSGTEFPFAGVLGSRYQRGRTLCPPPLSAEKQ